MSRNLLVALIGSTLLLAGVVYSADATTIDLTTAGASGILNGAVFTQVSPQPTGTGVIDPFVRLGFGSGNDRVLNAYNTTVNNVLDNGSADNWNHEIRVSDIPVVDLGGTLYRQFLLDINQTRSHSLLSLDEIQIFLSGDANQSVESFTNGILDLANASLIYQLDAGGDNMVLLDYALNHGSGSGDMIMLIPDALFVGPADQFVYLYSEFGLNHRNNGGFEEWAVQGNQAEIPEPTTIALLATGSLCLVRKRRKSA